MAAALAVGVICLNAIAAQADPIDKLREAYNRDVRSLTAGPDPVPSSETTITPGEAARRFDLGPVDVQNFRQLSERPALGTRLAVRGDLIVSDAEEMVETAAPKWVRVYGPPTAEDGRSLVPLDISSLDGSALNMIFKHCTIIPCAVTVHGMVGEVEAERVRNLFAADGAMTMMIGVVADRIQFHEAQP